MKFSTGLVTLIAAVSTVFSHSITAKRDENATKNCKDIYTGLSTCIINLNFYYDGACEKFKTQECQDVFNKYNSEENKACLNMEVSVAIANLKISCSKDEKGEYCPIAKFAKENPNKEITEEIVKETCKSKACRELAIDSMTVMSNLFTQYENAVQQMNAQMGNKPNDAQMGNKPNDAQMGNKPDDAQMGNKPDDAQMENKPNDDDNKTEKKEKRDSEEKINTVSTSERLNSFLAILKEDKCAAQASGATSIRVGSTLLFTLGLILYFL